MYYMYVSPWKHNSRVITKLIEIVSTDPRMKAGHSHISSMYVESRSIELLQQLEVEIYKLRGLGRIDCNIHEGHYSPSL